MCGLLLASRGIVEGVEHVKSKIAVEEKVCVVALAGALGSASLGGGLCTCVSVVGVEHVKSKIAVRRRCVRRQVAARRSLARSAGSLSAELAACVARALAYCTPSAAVPPRQTCSCARKRMRAVQLNPNISPNHTLIT